MNIEHDNCRQEDGYTIGHPDGTRETVCGCEARRRSWDKAQAMYPGLDPFAALVKAANTSPRKAFKQFMKSLVE